MQCRGVAQLVARLVWDQDAAGSNPVTPTIKEAGFPEGEPALFMLVPSVLGISVKTRACQAVPYLSWITVIKGIILVMKK